MHANRVAPLIDVKSLVTIPEKRSGGHYLEQKSGDDPGNQPASPTRLCQVVHPEPEPERPRSEQEDQVTIIVRIKNVAVQDEVNLIGQQNQAEILVEEVAEKAGVTTVNKEFFVKHGLASKTANIKVLSRGADKFTAALEITADAFSAPAKTAIEAKKGKALLVVRKVKKAE